jgi:hypothetical protein
LYHDGPQRERVKGASVDLGLSKHIAAELLENWYAFGFAVSMLVLRIARF